MALREPLGRGGEPGRIFGLALKVVRSIMDTAVILLFIYMVAAIFAHGVPCSYVLTIQMKNAAGTWDPVKREPRQACSVAAPFRALPVRTSRAIAPRHTYRGAVTAS